MKTLPVNLTQEECRKLEEAILVQVVHEPQKKDDLYSLWSKILNIRISMEITNDKETVA
jgi:hypothetical protein